MFVGCVAIRSIDSEEAMSSPGVVTFLTAKDIPGSNLTGPAVYDETVLADGMVIIATMGVYWIAFDGNRLTKQSFTSCTDEKMPDEALSQYCCWATIVQYLYFRCLNIYAV